MYIWSPPRIHFQLPVTAYANQTQRKGKWNKCNSCRWRHHPPCIRARSPLTLPSNVLCSMNNNSPGTKWSHPKLLNLEALGLKIKVQYSISTLRLPSGQGPDFYFFNLDCQKFPTRSGPSPKESTLTWTTEFRSMYLATANHSPSDWEERICKIENLKQPWSREKDKNRTNTKLQTGILIMKIG